MRDNRHDIFDPQAWRRRRAGCAVMLVAGSLSILASACGGGSASPGVASVGSTATTTAAHSAPAGNSGTSSAGALKYARCMRTHGFPTFPDPNTDGGFTDAPSNANPSNPKYTAANDACQSNLGHGRQLSSAQEQQIEANALELARCMRSHGVPNYPDPTINFSGGGVSQAVNLKGTGLSPSSPIFQRAQRDCQPVRTGGGS